MEHELGYLVDAKEQRNPRPPSLVRLSFLHIHVFSQGIYGLELRSSSRGSKYRQESYGDTENHHEYGGFCSEHGRAAEP